MRDICISVLSIPINRDMTWGFAGHSIASFVTMPMLYETSKHRGRRPLQEPQRSYNHPDRYLKTKRKLRNQDEPHLLNKVCVPGVLFHWTDDGPCPVALTVILMVLFCLTANTSIAGAFIMPPVLTFPVVHPRTSSLAWTISSPADPVAWRDIHFNPCFVRIAHQSF